MEKMQYKEKKTIRMDRELWERIVEVSKDIEYKNQNDLFNQIMWIGVRNVKRNVGRKQLFLKALKDFWKTI